MKNFNEYINEELDKIPLWCTIVLDIFKASKHLTKDNIIELLNGLNNSKRLKRFSDCLSQEYSKEYLAYQPDDDEFLKEDKQQKIREQIAEFIMKYIQN
jgi:hypothetical protein